MPYTYRRPHAAIACIVQTYRAPNAVQDAMRAFGYPADLATSISRRLHRYDPLDAAIQMQEKYAAEAGLDLKAPRVRALLRAIAGFEAEITGRKRFQTLARTGMTALELNGTRFVVNPLWNWSLEDLKTHILAHALPRHPLVEDGFLSIGCMPCTRRVAAGGDYRSGRWAGLEKDECGMHAGVDGEGI